MSKKWKTLIKILIIYFLVFQLILSMNLFSNNGNVPDIITAYVRKPQPAILSNSYLMLVNKDYYVDKDYTPLHLVNPRDYGVKTANDDVLVPLEVLTNYMEMVEALDLDNLYIFSGYRNYAKQEALYNYYRNDNYSARPGFSEHHTGFALDLSTLDTGLEIFFARTKEYQILIENSYKYGFILRYPLDKSDETGYYYEPWHFRYVGVIHATIITKTNITLEQYIKENFDI